jgi:hypothetical protein
MMSWTACKRGRIGCTVYSDHVRLKDEPDQLQDEQHRYRLSRIGCSRSRIGCRKNMIGCTINSIGFMTAEHATVG